MLPAIRLMISSCSNCRYPDLIFVPNHQIDGQSFKSPIGMGMDKLPHQIDLALIGNPQQHNRQVAGDAMSP